MYHTLDLLYLSINILILAFPGLRGSRSRARKKLFLEAILTVDDLHRSLQQYNLVESHVASRLAADFQRVSCSETLKY